MRRRCYGIGKHPSSIGTNAGLLQTSCEGIAERQPPLGRGQRATVEPVVEPDFCILSCVAMMKRDLRTAVPERTDAQQEMPLHAVGLDDVGLNAVHGCAQ